MWVWWLKPDSGNSSVVKNGLLHLFLRCQFAKICWGVLHLHINQDMDPFAIIESLHQQLNIPFFMDVIIIMSWCIWMVRNDLIFRNVQPALDSYKALFKKRVCSSDSTSKRKPKDIYGRMDRFSPVISLIFCLLFFCFVVLFVACTFPSVLFSNI